jgi:formate hydrogenlyase subunit 3/multisubunit Na+/H+ antiporter MnhD subunit
VFFGKKKTLILVLLLFFCLSGLPMSNFFLLKWFCFYKLYLSGVYYFVVMFFILNIFFLVFYFFFFKKITLYLNNNNNYAKALSNQYQLILLNLFIIYINIFGFLYINYTYMLVL